MTPHAPYTPASDEGVPIETRNGSFLARRFATDRPAGLRLTVVALIGSAGLVAFLILASAAGTGVGVDEGSAVLRDHARDNRAILVVGLAATAVGSVWTIGALALAVGAALTRRRRFDLLACWLLGLAGGGLVCEVLKWAVGRSRPVFPNPVAAGRGPSFPSGHTFGAVVCFGLLAYLAVRTGRSRRTRAAVFGVAAALVTAVGLSRLALGVHYTTDVLAGYAAGVCWLSVWLGAVEATRRARPQWWAGKFGEATGEERR